MTLKLKRSVLVLSLGLIAIIGMSAVLAKVMSYTPKPQSVVFNIVPSNANFPLESQVIGARMSADDGLVGHVLTITNTAQTPRGGRLSLSVYSGSDPESNAPCIFGNGGLGPSFTLGINDNSNVTVTPSGNQKGSLDQNPRAHVLCPFKGYSVSSVDGDPDTAKGYVITITLK